jgi:hypothetical protein
VWQAFYLPDSATILVHVNGGPCNATLTSTSTPDSITITAVPIPPRRNVACALPITGTVIHLDEAVGQRAIHAAGGSTGTSYNLANRLHQPVTGSNGLPEGGQVAPTATGDKWTLAYGYGSPPIGYLLVSAPDDHHHHYLTSTVRHHPAITPCPATLCWLETGLIYSIAPLGGADNTLLNPSQAQTLAATLS